MTTLQGKMAGLVASLVALGSLPLLAFMVVFVRLSAARAAGQASGADALGLAMMAMLAYGMAFLFFLAGAAYFGYQRVSKRKRPGAWHAVVLAGAALALLAPPVYFLF